MRKTGIGLLVATHDALVYSEADRAAQIQDGVIVTSN
jgi:ABC-type lipoprotein export system ATPase subunit